MRVLALALIATLLGGCTSSPAKPTPTTSGDRDFDAVVAALRALDPCALLADAKTTVRSGPFACRSGDDPVLTVTVGVWLDPATPRAAAPVAGVRAVQASGDRYCSTTLFTGADLGIAFTADTTEADQESTLCQVAADAAAAAAGLLAEPDELTASAPHQDSCDLLRRAGRDAAVDVTDGLDLRFGTTAATGLGLCQAREAVDGGWRTRFSARVVHTKFGSIRNELPDVLNGRDVRIYPTGEDCEYGWRVRGSGETDPAYPDRVIQVRGRDCAEAAKLAAALMPTDDEASPSVTPQRPITEPA
jgi:hypothetical protein